MTSIDPSRCFLIVNQLLWQIRCHLTAFSPLDAEFSVWASKVIGRSGSPSSSSSVFLLPLPVNAHQGMDVTALPGLSTCLSCQLHSSLSHPFTVALILKGFDLGRIRCGREAASQKTHPRNGWMVFWELGNMFGTLRCEKSLTSSGKIKPQHCGDHCWRVIDY